MTMNIDIPATTLNLAGLDIPRVYQGKSFLPIINDMIEPNGRKDFLCEYLWDIDLISKWEVVRSERYINARYFGQNPSYEFLHNLKVVPDQIKSFSDDPKYESILKKCVKEQLLL